ncbi:MAG: WG repeat-containing protein [Bacteroidia bacterium]
MCTDSEAPISFERFPARNGDKWGYIDAQGTFAISPTYDGASRFAEGLAAVKKGKRFGYIDLHGKEVLPFQYEWAGPFEDSIAIVKQAGQAFPIDHRGKPLFQMDAVSLERTPYPNCFIYGNNEEKYGLVDRHGIILAPAQFSTPPSFEQGVAIVQRWTPASRGSRLPATEYGVIDTLGQMRIAFGKYLHIRAAGEDFFFAENLTGKGDSVSASLVGSDGVVRFQNPTLSGGTWDVQGERFHEGLIQGRDLDFHFQARAPALLDRRGQMVYHCADCEFVYPIAPGILLGKGHSGKYALMNLKGELIYLDALDWVVWDRDEPSTAFESGCLIAGQGDHVVGIDTTGSRIWAYKSTHAPAPAQFWFRKGNVIYLQQWTQNEFAEPVTLYGYWLPKTGTVVKPRFTHIDPTIGLSKLTEVIDQGSQAYINDSGIVIWKEKFVLRLE